MVDKRKEIGVVPDGAKGEEQKDKKKFSGCFLRQGPPCEELSEEVELECNHD